MRTGAAGSDRWHQEHVLDEQGFWTFQIRAFADDFETWHHNTEVKLAAGVDADLMMLEGIRLFPEAASESGRSKANAKILVEAAETLAEAARVIQVEPAALQLRYLQTLVEMSGEKNSTIIPIPLDIVTALNGATKLVPR